MDKMYKKMINELDVKYKELISSLEKVAELNSGNKEELSRAILDASVNKGELSVIVSSYLRKVAISNLL